MMASLASDFRRFFNTSKQLPSIHQILLATPYTSALCRAQASVAGSFSIAKTCVKRPERAKAMALPPAPANVSMMIDFEEGPPVFTWSAIRLFEGQRWFVHVGEVCYSTWLSALELHQTKHHLSSKFHHRNETKYCIFGASIFANVSAARNVIVDWTDFCIFSGISEASS